MKLFSSGYLDDAFMGWLSSSMSCCGETLREQEPNRVEKPMRIEFHQPRLVPPPIPELQERPSTRGRDWTVRSRNFASRASSRGSFSVRRKLNAYNGPRRTRNQLVISGPTNFRHVENSMPRRREAFRPLELSIYMPDNQLSPILPHFKPDDLSFESDDLKALPYPPAAITHTRSESLLSHQIPRKPIRSESRASSEWTAQFKPRPESLSTQELLAALEKELPKAPPPARLRAMTEPPAYEKVKSALHERLELERRLKDIDEQIEERRSIYLSSRPTSRAASTHFANKNSIFEESEEPMPAPPVLKPSPSFATRVSSLPFADQRPRTAPAKTVHIPKRHKSFTEASAAFNSPPQSQVPFPLFAKSLKDRDLPPPPPLPLVLQAPRPPLRKKKSFSLVSTWLFPEHTRNISLDSVTNMPKPVTSREGFYQCVEMSHSAPARTSVDSRSTVSTLESELDAPTIPTAWTPQSSPGKRDVTIRTLSMDDMRDEKSVELTRLRTFGEREMGADEKWRMDPGLGVQGVPVPGRNSVGVAF